MGKTMSGSKRGVRVAFYGHQTPIRKKKQQLVVASVVCPGGLLPPPTHHQKASLWTWLCFVYVGLCLVQSGWKSVVLMILAKWMSGFTKSLNFGLIWSLPPHPPPNLQFSVASVIFPGGLLPPDPPPDLWTVLCCVLGCVSCAGWAADCGASPMCKEMSVSKKSLYLALYGR